MEKKFVVPAVSFLAAVLIWTTFFVIYLSSNEGPEPSLLLKSLVCLVVAGLVVFSGIRCHKLGGPRVGSIVRAGLLLVLAILTFWKVGVIEAGILLVGGIALGIKAVMATGKPETGADVGVPSSERDEDPS